ncbi:hypothetical protein OQH61_08600 [Helicobacter sp. MIT 21-1697]|uniref:hypothetical protein n=1 Tax=Helicobacter sp. MIT 21-1697 TaxID=2993733 RepID=UPI00224AA6C7|nr:hypothetical protein [Helicobacter sp. MIT 21-1697]MCX2717789.1 hypothetical protein [Helicobacter sp. MIT 21-1697]
MKNARTGAFDAQGNEFKEGDRVVGIFGEGIVVYVPHLHKYMINLGEHYYELEDSWIILY